MANGVRQWLGLGETETPWGTRIVKQGGYGGPVDVYTGGYQSPEYGGSGLIYLGSNEWEGTNTYARVNEDLMGTSQYGAWGDVRGDFESRLNELSGVSVDSWLEAYDVFDELNRIGEKSSVGLLEGPQGMYRYNYGAYPETGADYLTRHAEARQKYDQSIARFNEVYSGALQTRDQRDREHADALAKLDAQRQASEAAMARSQAWASNRITHNRQEQNIPDVVTAGTADSGQGSEEGSVDQNIGGTRRRRRGALSTNLGIQV